MITAKKYKIDNWYGFYDRIDEAVDDFFIEKKRFPNYIVFNDHTYSQICFLFSVSPLRHYIIDDSDEQEITISKFEYDDCVIDCLTGGELRDKEFELLYDNETDYDDDDDDDDGDMPVEPVPRGDFYFA